MNEIRPIDANLLRKNMEFICMGIMAGTEPYNAPLTEIDNAPTVDTSEKYNNGYEKGYKHGYKDGQNSSRPQFVILSEGECKCITCKYRSCEITEKPCRECSHSWSDLYEEAEMKGGAE